MKNFILLVLFSLVSVTAQAWTLEESKKCIVDKTRGTAVTVLPIEIRESCATYLAPDAPSEGEDEEICVSSGNNKESCKVYAKCWDKERNKYKFLIEADVVFTSLVVTHTCRLLNVSVTRIGQ